MNKKIQKEVVSSLGGDGEGSPSGSVSDVLAQEDDVVWKEEERNHFYKLIRREKNLPDDVNVRLFSDLR